MGACCCTDASTKQIESKLREHEKIEKSTVKLLFLGPGGSGKSTIFKQLEWLHSGGYTEKAAKSLIHHIHCQIVHQMQDCIKHYLSQNSSICKQDKLQDAINTVHNYKSRDILTSEIADCINFIWQNDKRLDGIFKVHHTTKILDETTEYFWNDIERICDMNYIPNKQDIINVRYRTTGIVEKHFVMKQQRFHIFDVGGQKSERKKWIQCFQDVKTVIFVISLSCFNEFMYEDTTKNAMVDALQLFNKTVNDKHFNETPIILFLNKRDLFQNKIIDIPITICPIFDDFDVNTKNPNDYEDTIKYIKSEFEAQCDHSNRNIYIHITCAMDPKNIQNVFDDITNIILHDIKSNTLFV